ncbi:hypothetical protein DIPPA_00850 [Diplonema papillatum]|nr:hypothetical protein DIPPA_00850 [Diplonema papillatum]
MLLRPRHRCTIHCRRIPSAAMTSALSDNYSLREKSRSRPLAPPPVPPFAPILDGPLRLAGALLPQQPPAQQQRAETALNLNLNSSTTTSIPAVNVNHAQDRETSEQRANPPPHPNFPQKAVATPQKSANLLRRRVSFRFQTVRVHTRAAAVPVPIPPLPAEMPHAAAFLRRCVCVIRSPENTNQQHTDTSPRPANRTEDHHRCEKPRARRSGIERWSTFVSFLHEYRPC